MLVKKIKAKSILSKSKVFDYTINPYIGCQYGCTYCYARVMKRFTGHKEAWGEFVDVKVNAAQLLEKEVKRKKVGKVWISGMCDPYQPLEKKYEITKGCLEILSKYDWPIVIQTKSPLVLRDIKLLKKFTKAEVGFTITTSDERIRKIFEPNAPSIQSRVKALEKLSLNNIETYAMIGPILPKAESLVEKLNGKVCYVLIDKMNYHYADWAYRKYKLEYALTDEFFLKKGRKLKNSFEKIGIECKLLFSSILS